MARLLGVRVLVFSLGFGRRLLTFKKGGVEYVISAFPLGGYVKLLGESEEEPVSEQEMPFSYAHKPPHKKLLIALSGPLFNVIFAFLVFYFICLSGYNVLLPYVGKVEEGYPASEAGIKEGDLILSVDGKEIREWFDISAHLSEAKEGPILLKILRDGIVHEIAILPKEIEQKNILGETIRRRVIGISPASRFVERREDPLTAFRTASYQTVGILSLTVKGIVKLIEGTISPRTIGGPLTIFEIAGREAKEGKRRLLSFVALISINLAVINLFPIPMLDGGHILFHLIEIASRRSISLRWVQISQKIGLGILICLMALALFNDFLRIFFER
jgi:regulator of sigma E protease